MIIRSKEEDQAKAEEEAAKNKGSGKRGKGGGGGGPDVEALKQKAKMDRELVAIEKLMEERRAKRQKRDDGFIPGQEEAA